MKFSKIITLLLLTFTLSINAQRYAIAVLTPTANGDELLRGTLFIVEQGGKANITGNFTGLRPGAVHAVHIHEFGYIGSTDGLGAGGHYNPFNSQHGAPTNPIRHAGDLGNVTANEQGVATLSVLDNNLVFLSGNASVVGRTVILHERRDDGTGGGTGDAGSRFLQGVVGIRNIVNNTAVNEHSTFATCELKGVRDDLIYGRVNFNLEGSLVRVNTTICGLVPDSIHGFHVHTWGDLSGPTTATNVGGHYNPTNQIHAYPDGPRHLGDMGNVTASSTGFVLDNKVLNLLVLNGTNSIVGRAVVLHQFRDDGGGATGNAGTMIATCVIGVVNTLPPLLSSCKARSPQTGIAVLSGTAGFSQIQGNITIVENVDQTSNITGIITGLPPNSVHSVHIHEFGFLGTSDGSGVGGHYNPFNSQHGGPTNPIRHAGDLGNITTNGQGIAFLNVLNNDLVSLHGLSSVVGRAVIVHERRDDGTGGGTGDAGARWAQGVIGIQNIAGNVAVQQNSVLATCELRGVTLPQIHGRVIFERFESTRVRVTADVCGLSPESLHGFHVHTWGDLSGATTATNVGGHYNPFGQNHAYPDFPNRHVGDMGNVTANEFGAVNFTRVFDLLTLTTANSIVGRSVVLHKNRDDGTGASGNAGEMIATCVIGVVSTLPPRDICNESNEAVVLLSGTVGHESVNGNVTIRENPDGTTNVIGFFGGLVPNAVHAVHIHEFGYIGTPDGSGTGGHFNPFNSPHGGPTNPVRHVGDLGNITTDALGNARLEIFNNTLIKIEGPNSVIGRGFIVHERRDDGTGGGTGDAGSRWAQGVIGIKNRPDNYAYQRNATIGTCELLGVVNPYLKGRIIFEQVSPTQVRVTGTICSLAPNAIHGFHVHTFGDLTGPLRSSSVGGHYNPLNDLHQYPEVVPRHLGDMGNVTASSTGVASVDRVYDLLSLTGPNSIFGRAVVLHANRDDGTGSTGNAGTMIATCVIGVVNNKPPLPVCPSTTLRAVAVLRGTQATPMVNGTINIVVDTISGAANVTGRIGGLTPNAVHAIHIHEFGYIGSTDGLGAGGHYNPFNSQHGAPTNPIRHAGDLGNLTTNAQGEAVLSVLLNDKIFLNGPYSVIGRTVIVHERRDDGTGGGTGDAGSRFAQGVIGIQNVVDNAADQLSSRTATCEIQGVTDSNLFGRVVFDQLPNNNVLVSVSVCGLSAGDHGFHVHTWGDLSGVTLSSNVGGHFNPTNVSHAYPDGPRHVGDMGNITANSNLQVLNYTKEFNLLTLTKPLESIVGRAVVIHANRDDGTGATGNAGSLIATCVVGVVNQRPPPLPACPTVVVPTTVAPRPSTSRRGVSAGSRGSMSLVSFLFVLVLLIFS